MATEHEISRCRGCDRKIIWARLYDEETNKLTEKLIPCDAVAAVYFVEPRGEDNVITASRRRDCFVSHFVTCSKANRFTKKKRKKEYR